MNKDKDIGPDGVAKRRRCHRCAVYRRAIRVMIGLLDRGDYEGIRKLLMSEQRKK